jgi:two-component sensor histidine kinase
MRLIFPPIKSKPLFNLDFSLAYIGILFLGFSIAGTELFKLYPESKMQVIQVRIIHTIFFFALVYLTQKLLQARKITKTGYLGLALIGLSLALPALLFRILLMENFGLIASSQIRHFFTDQFFISLIQAFFWIPVVTILGGQRSLIIEAFKEYEKRLVISARKNIRESNEFVDLKKDVDKSFRDELIMHSRLLLNSLIYSDDKKLSLKERNEIKQRYLRGNSLREFSRNLNQKSEAITNNSKFEQDMRSLDLVRKQFNILYNFTARNAPVPAWVYTLLSFVLLLPNYINFFTAFEGLISLPPLFLIHIIAVQINRTLRRGGKYAILKTNLMTLLIGLLPFIEMNIFRIFFPDLAVIFPVVISGVFYPLAFFVYMRFIQIIQPEAISAIKGEEIYASPALKSAISKIVKDEFKQSMSHQWATFIHGKILTRLAATSLKLEQAVSSNDIESFETGLKNIELVLEDPTREFEQNILTLKSEISSRLDPWDGLISIKIAIDSVLENVSNQRVKDLGEVIEEIISNSVRHGGSQSISINITSGNHPDIKVKIEDDAVNPLPLFPTRIGLGTKILNLVSDGRWSISRDGGKTTVNLTMALLERQVSNHGGN